MHATFFSDRHFVWFVGVGISFQLTFDFLSIVLCMSDEYAQSFFLLAMLASRHVKITSYLTQRLLVQVVFLRGDGGTLICFEFDSACRTDKVIWFWRPFVALDHFNSLRL